MNYNIDELVGNNYNIAIQNVIWTLNRTMGTKFFEARDKSRIEDLAQRLGMKFDADGNIIRNSYYDNL